MWERVNFSSSRRTLINKTETSQVILSINIHGTRTTDSYLKKKQITKREKEMIVIQGMIIISIKEIKYQPSRHDLLNVRVGSCSLFILIRASRIIGPHLSILEKNEMRKRDRERNDFLTHQDQQSKLQCMVSFFVLDPNDKFENFYSKKRRYRKIIFKDDKKINLLDILF